MKYSLFFLLPTSILFLQCHSPGASGPVNFQPEEIPYKKLSQYAFFAGEMKQLQPNERVLPFDLITPLFTDYAHKSRFVWMPAGLQATVNEEGIIEFPDNAVLIKNFFYPSDFRRPERKWDIVETRLLVKRNGEWEAFTYIWNREQTDAELNVIGDFRDVSWVDIHGEKQAIQYVVPNKNQCKSCHNIDNRMQPIGPKARNLNRPLSYPGGITSNQLVKWQETGMLAEGDYQNEFKPVANFEDPQSGDIEERALAYLDVNCGHCHNPKGPAHTTGMFLTLDYKAQKSKLGFCKTPVAAGKGAGNLRYGIAPGRPDSSILVYRMESTDPAVMMPELGRVIKHKEGIALVREWIGGLREGCGD